MGKLRLNDMEISVEQLEYLNMQRMSNVDENGYSCGKFPCYLCEYLSDVENIRIY